MNISAYTPIMDSDFKYITMYLKNLEKKVNEIIFIYTGNNINLNTESLNYEGIKVKFFNYPVNNPYCWPEGAIRNFALSKCENDWILPLDVDEVIDDNIISLDLSIPCIYQFLFIPFWYDLKTVRVNTEKDSHWYPNKINRLHHKSLVKYQENQNHSFYSFSLSDIKQSNLSCYHLHYVDQFNEGLLKPRDNRSGDFQKYENLELDSKGVYIKKEDYYALNTTDNIKKYYECKVVNYIGDYPECLKSYIDKI